MVVHVSSGVSALVCALVLGKRIGFPAEPMPPHNVVFSLIGAGLLWVGWFGFNAGSAVNAGALASSAFAATHFSAAAAALGWGVTEWWLKGRPSVLGVASGMVAGLATITPASGFVTRSGGIFNRIDRRGDLLPGGEQTQERAALRRFARCLRRSRGWKRDGLAACWGCWRARRSTRPSATPSPPAARRCRWPEARRSWAINFIGLIFTVVLAAAGTFVILKVVGALVGLRVTPEEEDSGLDLTQHGESAYND